MISNRLTFLGAASAIFVGACIVVLLIQYNSTLNACPLPDYDSYSGEVVDLLIVSGDCVVPTAIEAIQDRRRSKRPFIIGFLGQTARQEALAPLVQIVNDESDPHRGVAIIAIFRIDPEKGRDLANNFKVEQSDLGANSRDILLDKQYLHARTTYLGALRRYIIVKYGL